MGELEIRQTEIGEGKMLLVLSGFLDAHSFEVLEAELDNVFAESVYHLVIDLSMLNYISSAGAGVFIGAHARAQENNGEIVFCNPQPTVKQVFDLLGMTQLFNIVGSREDAMAIFNA